MTEDKSTIVFQASAKDFEKIPGTPIAYWVSENLVKTFENGSMLENLTEPRKGLATTDNDRFLRMWFEISISTMGIGYTNREIAKHSRKKWFPLNKGGNFRRWYGNKQYVINWYNDGEELKKAIVQRYNGGSYTKEIRSEEKYFMNSITWSALTIGSSSFRLSDYGALFDSAGSSMFPVDNTTYLLAFLNTKISDSILQLINPTLNYGAGTVSKLPVLFDNNRTNIINSLAESSIKLSRADWDAFETSWDFQRHPLAIVHPEYGTTSSVFINGVEQDVHQVPLLQLHYAAWERECRERFNQLKANEEELNRIFIEIYGLQDELTPEVEDKDVTVRLADKTRDIRSFISYLVGVIMGRYSLDTPGLAYAGGEWDATKYTTYQPDDDGIVPIYPSLGMEDGLAARIIDLIKQIYGEESYYENIDFIAEALGKARNESSEETLNRYLNDGFYADHLKIYQKRPIYWLLSSGKHGGFKCLIYMHRYRADTLARVNGRYFLPETTRQKYELQELEKQVASAEGRERVKLEKERQKRTAAYHEALEYGQILDHLANQSIEIDLDDGVKVNYAKFQGVELVTDSGAKVKKDLLVPIK